MKISLIAAVARNRAIGLRNRLPWSLPEDLKHFRAVTSGHAVIMGRKTYESIGRLLPNRKNIIITRNPNYRVEGAVVVQSLDLALQACGTVDEVFVIGGAEIYSMALSRADRLYLTHVDQDVEGDAFFPDWTGQGFIEIARENVKGAPSFSFVTYERR